MSILARKHPNYLESDFAQNEEYFTDLIRKHKSFSVKSTNLNRTARDVERMIENSGLRCRVYTENRSAALGAAAIPTGVTQVTGLFSAIGIAAHNLATFNPDYEIGKNIIDSQINVTYKK